MNELVERLRSATLRFGGESRDEANIRRNNAIKDAIAALEAADRMADQATRASNTFYDVGMIGLYGPMQILGMNIAAYRTATQKKD